MKILPLTQLLIGKNKSIYVLEVTLSLCQDTVESWDLVIKIKEEKEEIDCEYIIMNFVNISNLKLEINHKNLLLDEVYITDRKDEGWSSSQRYEFCDVEEQIGFYFEQFSVEDYNTVMD